MLFHDTNMTETIFIKNNMDLNEWRTIYFIRIADLQNRGKLFNLV